MDLSTAKEKYLNKVVLHKEKPHLFEIANVYMSGNEIIASFRHLYYSHVPIGQPVTASLEELEKNYKVIG